MIDYKMFKKELPPLDVEIVVSSSDRGWPTPAPIIVTFESKYTNDYAWHLSNLNASHDMWMFINKEDEHEWKDNVLNVTDEYVRKLVMISLESKITELNRLRDEIVIDNYTTVSEVKGAINSSIDIITAIIKEKGNK